MKSTAKKVESSIVRTLKDSELRYRRLFEATQDGILILDAKTGMIADVNPYLIKMLGYSREEFIKKKLWEVGAFKDIEASQEAFEDLQEKEYIRYEDLPLKAKNGQLIQVEFVSNVYLVGEEKVIQCNIRDITKHKQIIVALQENEKKYYDLVNQSPEGVFIIELSGHILIVNKAMCRELAFSEEEFLSMSIWDIIPEQYLDQYRERLTKILKGESLKESTEYEVRGKDGKIHYVEVLSAPHYSGKDIIGFQGIARDITARKRAEEVLRESERRFQLASWATKDIIWERNYPANTIAWNDGLQKLFHYSAEEIEPTVDWWQDRIHPAERIKVINSIQTAIDQGENFWSKEYRFRLVDGSYANIFDRGYFLYDEQGKPLQLIGAMVDVTEQKRAEDALRSSEEKYHRLVDEVNDGIYATDDAEVFTFANSALARIYGVADPQALLGRKFTDFLASEKPAPLNQAHGSAMQSGSALQVINGQILRPDGTSAFIEIKPTMTVKDGQIVGTQGVVRDITEHKQAEEALRTSEERFKTIFVQAPLGIALIGSLTGHIYEANPRFAKIAGRSMEELENIDGMQITHPDDVQADLDKMALLNAGKINGFQMEKRYLHPDGTAVWINMTIAPMKVDDKAQPRHLCMIEDITDRKRAEERIKRQLDHLTASSGIDRVISANFDLKLSLSEILNHVTKELDVDAADILILNPGSQMLEFGAERGFRAKAIRNAQVRVGESYAGRSALEMQLIQVPHLEDEPDNILLKTHLAGENFICYFGLPLIVKGQVKGVLEVFHRSALEPDEDWFDFLKTLAWLVFMGFSIQIKAEKPLLETTKFRSVQ